MSRKAELLIAAGALICLLSGCNRELAVKSAYICDDFANGVCREGAPKNGIYSFNVPAEKTGTWFDFAYHMYFHSRQTPGMRVDLTRGLKAAEQDLRRSARCTYRIQKGANFVEDHMEGLRWDDDASGLWCFDYLGTMLVKYHKKYGSIQQKPSPEFFPVELTISLGGGLSAEQTEGIRLEWQTGGEVK